jgi:hypothetical protein
MLEDIHAVVLKDHSLLRANSHNGIDAARIE